MHYALNSGDGSQYVLMKHSLRGMNDSLSSLYSLKILLHLDTPSKIVLGIEMHLSKLLVIL